MKTNKVEFMITTSYHRPLGSQKKGHQEFGATSRCYRWYVRVGNFGTMIVTDRKNDTSHVVKGKMPEVQAFVDGAVSKETNQIKVQRCPCN